MLDNFVGQMAAMNVPHDFRHMNELPAPLDTVPMNTRFLAAILDSAARTDGRVRQFIRAMAQQPKYSEYAIVDELGGEVLVRSKAFEFWLDFVRRDLLLR